MNWTNSSIVRRMHIADFKSGALASEPSGSERGERTQMFYLIEHVFLRHELGKLVGSEKFLDTSLERTLVDDVYWKRSIDVDNRHSILDISLDLHHSSADFLLEYFSYESHTSLA